MTPLRSVGVLLAALVTAGADAQTPDLRFAPDLRVFEEQASEGTFETLAVPAVYVVDPDGRGRLALSGGVTSEQALSRLDAVERDTAAGFDLDDLLPHLDGDGVPLHEAFSGSWTALVVVSTDDPYADRVVRFYERYATLRPHLGLHILEARYDHARSPSENPEARERPPGEGR